jgi:nucleotide-binding universal stress UspA family protein
VGIENILFPTDFSEPAKRALPHALVMATKCDSRITLLHVRVLFEDDPNQTQYHFFEEGKYAGYIEGQLEEIRQKFTPDHRVSTATVRGISPAAGILDYLEQNQVDAVVMGTHGRSPLGRFLLGTVTEKVVRHAPCAVLTVAHHRMNYRGNPDYRKMLVPFDFSEYSVEALLQARALALKYQSDLQVLHVLTPQLQPFFYELWKISNVADLPKFEATAKRALVKSLGKLGLKGLKTHVEDGRGDRRASEIIVKFAEENLVDLIVMGTHGLTGIGRVLLGSTTERVVRTAPCPVLTVHGSKA